MIAMIALLKRNIFTTISILFYLYWWGYFIYWFTFGRSEYPHSCGVANAGMLVLHLLVIAFYSLIMLINVILRSGENRLDYLKFLLIIIAPPVLLYLILVIN